MEISKYYISRLPTPSLLFTFTRHCLLTAALCVLGLEAVPRYLESRVAFRQPCPISCSAISVPRLLYRTGQHDNTSISPLFLPQAPVKNPATTSPFIPLQSKCPLLRIKRALPPQHNKTMALVHILINA